MMNYQTITEFKKFAENAQVAGFDGVEVHYANGYLLDEFLRDRANKRAGYYGGSIGNRVRLMFEVIDIVGFVWSSERVGLRVSPLNSYNSMIDAIQSSFPYGLLIGSTIFILLIFT